MVQRELFEWNSWEFNSFLKHGLWSVFCSRHCYFSIHFYDVRIDTAKTKLCSSLVEFLFLYRFIIECWRKSKTSNRFTLSNPCSELDLRCIRRSCHFKSISSNENQRFFDWFTRIGTRWESYLFMWTSTEIRFKSVETRRRAAKSVKVVPPVVGIH